MINRFGIARFTLIFTIVIISFEGNGQLFSFPTKAETESYNSELQQFESPEKVYQFIEDVLKSNQDTSLIIAKAFQHAAFLHKQSDQTALAIIDATKSLAVYKQLLGNQHPSTAHSQAFLGQLYTQSESPHSAIPHLKAAARFFAGLKQRDAIPITSQLATSYREINQPDSALQAIDYTLRQLATSSTTAPLLLQKGELLGVQGKHKEALELFSEAIHTYESDCSNTFYEEQLINAYQLLGQTQFNLNKPKEAKESVHHALLNNQERPDLVEQRIHLLLDWQKIAHREDSSLTEAENEEIEALIKKMDEKIQGKFIHDKELEEARYLLKKGAFKKGIKQFGDALKHYIPERVNGSLPKPEQVVLASNKEELIQAYIEWVYYLKLENNRKKDRSLMRDALKLCQLSDVLVKEVLINPTLQIDATLVGTVYRNGAELAHHLDKPEEAWYFHERLRTMNLRAHYSILQIDQLTGVHDSLQRKRKRLALQQDSLMQFVLQLKATGKLYELKKHKGALELLHTKQQQNEEQLLDLYPKYKAFQKQLEPITLEAARDYLSDNGAELISYIVTDSSVLLMQVADWKKKLFTVPNGPEIKRKAFLFLELTTNATSDLQLIDSIGQSLYLSLYKPVAYGKKKVLLMTDQWLRRFPFEALVRPQKRKEPLADRWLVNHKRINYTTSIGLLKETNEETDTRTGMLIVAPEQFPDAGKPPLTKGEPVIRYMEKSFETDTLLGAAATAPHFMQQAMGKQAIHLTTHVQQFPQPVIYFREESTLLDTLKIEDPQASLWVITHLEWEGMQPTSVLTHEYLQQKGVKGIVSPLWRSQFDSSNELLQYFYKRLLSGDSQAKSLQKAKQHMIEEGKLMHPYHWAGYSHYGHSEKVRVAAYDGLTYVFAGFILLMLVVWSFGRGQVKEEEE